MTKTPTNYGEGPERVRPDMDRHINGLLQAMYGSIESEPIPQRFLDLLEKLDLAERSQSPNRPA